MGHDITAKRPGIDEAVLYEQLNIREHDDGWSDRYSEYCAQVEIAYVRRGGGDPLNQVLYLALGVMDEAYAGCSGNGSELDITLAQFESAVQILESKSFVGMTRERNFSDDVIDGLVAAGAAYIESPQPDPDVAREREFVEKCIAYMKGSGAPTLLVRFA